MIRSSQVAAEIRAQCLADLPDASGAAERAYQQVALWEVQQFLDGGFS